MEPLYGALLKVRRAKDQLEDLNREFERFIEGDAYSFSVESDNETGEQVGFVEAKRAIPLVWSVRIGEIVHDLRSSLDHMVWQLVIHDGGTPDKRNQFPIFTRETGRDSFENKGRAMLRGIQSSKIAFFEGLQPYPRLNPDFKLHPLLVLADLSNTDKHRLLHLTAMVFDPSKVRFTPHSGGFGKFRISTHAPIENRTEFMRVRTNGELEVEFEEAIKIAFYEAQFVRSRRVDEVITVLSDEVNKILVTAEHQLFV